MRMFGFPMYVLYLYLVATACASTTTTGSAGNNKKYHEDLSALRPKIEVPAEASTTTAEPIVNAPKETVYVEPQFTINKKLETVLDSIDQLYLSRKYVEGFTIQVFSGKREDAINTKKQLASYVPNVESEVQFTEPIFRVKAGKYYNRIEAQKDFMEIQKHFPAAIIVPERIELSKL